MASSTANISGDEEPPVVTPPVATPEVKVEAPKAPVKAAAPKVEAPVAVVETVAEVPAEFLSGEALRRAQEGVSVG